MQHTPKHRDVFAVSHGNYGDADRKAIDHVWSHLVKRPIAPVGGNSSLNHAHEVL